MGMQVTLNNPELQAKVDQWMKDTGRPADELVEDAIAGYLGELSQVRETLDSRYDDIKSGKVKMISGEEAYKQIMERIETRRSKG